MMKRPSEFGGTLEKLFSSGEFDAEQRWEEQGHKILNLNSVYNAYITIFQKPLVLVGYRTQPLRGISVAVKDVFHVKGYPTTAGSKLLRNHVSEETAVAVEKLLQKGAAINGKTNLHEFAFGVSSINPHYGPCINPYDRSRVAGGSSGGSAVAVALGMCDVALGTDTAGSVRIPASFCGVVGFKPSINSISTQGVLPLSWSLDHVGIMARNVWETALVYMALTENIDKHFDFWPQPLEGLKIGVPTNYFLEYLDRDVRKNFEKTLRLLESRGAEVVDVFVPEVEKAVKCRTIIGFAEAAAYHLRLCRGRLDLYGDDVRQRIINGLSIPAAVYLNAMRARKKLTRSFRNLFKRIDVLALPTTIIPAHGLEDVEVEVDDKVFDVRSASLRNTEVFNLYGTPAISLPMGLCGKGLPVGLQIVADLGEDVKLLRTAYAVEKSLTA
ncbi:MAG: amidase [Candidatus Caldarchaeum sp.]|nr:amidase [Candidatus Caldarchaeum sp.]